MPLVRKPDQRPAAAAPDHAGVAEALHSSDPERRWQAARTAAGMPGSAAMLAAAIGKETDPRIRATLFTGLARMELAEAAPHLLQLLRSDDAGLRTGALDALRSVGPALAGYLPGFLHDADADVRILSCELVRTVPGEQASQLLCELLAAEPEVNVCAAAVDVLGEVGSASAVPTLAECARRFAAAPFLVFSIHTVIDRIHSQPARPRG